MATKRKKKRGRPMERGTPFEEIDATPEEVAQVLLNLAPLKGRSVVGITIAWTASDRLRYPETEVQRQPMCGLPPGGGRG